MLSNLLPTILVVNCNTDEQVTAGIARTAQAAARTSVVRAVQPTWGPTSAEGYLESYLSAAAVIERVAQERTYDAVVLAGFGEHGREGVRQLANVPVVDITEAAVFTACLIGHRFGVVTTLESTLAGITDTIELIGLSGRSAGVRASGIPVSHAGAAGARTSETSTVAASAAGMLPASQSVPTSQARVLPASEANTHRASVSLTDPGLDALERESRVLLDAGADVIVLGCAAFGGLDRRLSERLGGVPVVDGVGQAVRLAETLLSAGLSTSKHGPFAPPRAKVWTERTLPLPAKISRPGV
ncbi:aspartate/glutamate racemase family protein [Mycetocola sp. JXN-3]|uniref:aspartate/glutamate racemase family protein n=1 Tax=Mycetocola sp. JXN-3 TaxID=2116510 RepID=UPI00165D2BDA|nr:aspartate/glutamate racemase family protein [Mycetocola sp. JXN-3]